MIKMVVIFCLIVAVASFSYQYYAVKKNQERAKRDYQPVEDIVVDHGGDRVVLLLHGFSTGPQEFQRLIPYFDAKNLSYVIPNLVGHNEKDTKIFETISYQEWEQQVFDTYQDLCQKYKVIDVVGFSNGGNLALKLSEKNEIQNLILINPFATPNRMLLNLYRLSQNNIGYSICKYLIGYAPMDPKMARPFYQYPYVPYESLLEILRLQDSIDFSAVSAKALFLIYGLKDATADYDILIEDKLSSHLKPEHITVLKSSTHRAMDEQELALIKSALDQAYGAL